ncbi:kynurenine formamidase [Methanococcus voltae]|uniref:Kynurenine formamidase n=2 Tax=Methanococcus voltae TaxID=2188 RepID=A0A8J7RGQ1_METVO|nr:cyclase family protein [Methanococcus voltae]MBP2200621.1 kynurenine formamidase [Methanococcus voltae]MCS3921346.1 kynurenine formamidase [Methanococcus voltae PS]
MNLKNNFGNPVSLSHNLINFVFPGDPEYKISKIDVDNFKISKIEFNSHIGTHIDFPGHLNHKNVNDTDFSKFPKSYLKLMDNKIIYENALCIFYNSKNTEYFENEDKFNELKDIINKNNVKILILNTNTYKLWGNPEYFNHDLKLDKYLERILELNIDIIATDCASIGNYNVHKKLLDKMLIIENLTNLEFFYNQIFVFLGMPLDINIPDGSPINIIGFINKY